MKAGEAEEALEGFMDELRVAGVRFLGALGQPMQFTPLGQPTAENNRLANWLSEAVEYGYINAGDIPSAWREKWGKPLPWERKAPPPTPAKPNPRPSGAARVTGWILGDGPDDDD